MTANTLEQVRQALIDKGEDYLLWTGLPASSAHISFIGRFVGQEVLWNMRLYTLDRYAQEPGVARAQIVPGLSGVMQIAPEATQVFQVKVALKVPVIDVPTIQKTILMLRNYRKLSIGVHTWGNGI